ncbi:MAG: CPBP family intramembrane metalloprotease [Alphaproteobacteria bacterium]|nr:MAG: CPBP family intramembrane metalloprotease [Alphaproteobacteria bacterium]
MSEARFWEPARERAQLWRLALGLVLVFAVWFAVSTAVLLAASALLGVPLGQIARADSLAGAAAVFLGFAGFHAGLALALPLLHRRGYRTLFGPQRRLELVHFARGAAVTLGIAAISYALMGLERLVLPPEIAPEIVRRTNLMPWLAGLLPAIALIAMQALAEEAVFRGYVLQQLRARSANVLIWGVAPSFLFGLLHFDATTFGPLNAAAYVFNAAVIGTLAALVTVKTGNLGAAAGLHFGNNVAMVLIGLKGSIEGFSLYLVEVDLESGYMTYSMLTQTALMVLAYLVWRRWWPNPRTIAKPGAGA